MRTLVCGDIHCKPHLLTRALNATEWDTFVFLGDACDNWGATQEDNLKIISQLIELKKTYGDRFIWLIGNHDWGYYDTALNLSGHIFPGSANVQKLLDDSVDLWDIMYSDGDHLFSHAGIGHRFLLDTDKISMWDMKHKKGLNNPLNRVGFACGGYDDMPSPIWARPEEVDPLPEEVVKCQIVGHTPVETITIRNDLIICDTMSQYRDGTFIGDKSLLLLDGDKKLVINGDTGGIIREL